MLAASLATPASSGQFHANVTVRRKSSGTAEDVARLSPLKFDHINMPGRYAFILPDRIAVVNSGRCGALRTPTTGVESNFRSVTTGPPSSMGPNAPKYEGPYFAAQMAHGRCHWSVATALKKIIAG
jgi:hypothetical protein